MVTREKLHRWDVSALLISLVLGAGLELASLRAMFSTMGHAGPEGSLALVGWIATGFNLPGLVLGAFLRLSPDASTLKIGTTLFLIQMPFVWYLTFVIVRLCKVMFARFHARPN